MFRVSGEVRTVAIGGCQKILPYASPAEVKKHVFEVFDAIGTSEGGIVACGEISEDVPLENIRAMYEAFLEYRY